MFYFFRPNNLDKNKYSIEKVSTIFNKLFFKNDEFIEFKNSNNPYDGNFLVSFSSKKISKEKYLLMFEEIYNNSKDVKNENDLKNYIIFYLEKKQLDEVLNKNIKNSENKKINKI